jgi:hemerythrin superfamily protein
MAKKQGDILSLIELDHRATEQLFDELEGTKAKKKTQELFNQIYKELTLHAKAEELVFYPAMMEYDETKQYVEEAEEEHNSVKILLEQMKALEPNDSEFENKMMNLKESVLHHVEEEESEIFDAVRERMDDQQLQKLGEEFQAAKSRLQSDVEAQLAMK